MDINDHLSSDSVQLRPTRRSTLKWSAGALGVAVFGSLPNFGFSETMTAELGKGDIGVLNYAYALEQLEAAFYTKVLAAEYKDMTADDRAILTDIRDHEVAHRDFLKKALADKAIGDLEVDFSAVDFTSRDAVLGTAKVFEDLGVAAYNGAGKLIENPDYLLAAGRIVSVEGRHAAVLRDMLQPDSVAFAGPEVVDKHGLDGALPPADVLKAAAPFIKTPIGAAGITG
ncbi:MAG: ferritin-like domain-containing protein [Pseudorhodobacter sp.]|nr:ferritin-like domain-containing protein [Pseudorhodobacter sp.]